jgi:hypothetical protein
LVLLESLRLLLLELDSLRLLPELFEVVVLSSEPEASVVLVLLSLWLKLVLVVVPPVVLVLVPELLPLLVVELLLLDVESVLLLPVLSFTPLCTLVLTELLPPPPPLLL